MGDDPRDAVDGTPVRRRRVAARGKRIVMIVAAFAAAGGASAQAPPANGETGEAALAPPRASADIVRLPVAEVLAIRRDGRIFLLSANGRFSFSGAVRDLWRGKTLDTLSALRDAAERVHFEEMGVDVKTLNSVTLGDGREEVVVFVDPRCAVCHRLIEDAAALGDEYTFRFVVIAALGAESNRLARTLYCARDRSAVLEALRDGVSDSLAPRADCESGGYERTLLLAHLLGVDGVPFLVAPDGRVARGRPRQLRSWLAGTR